MEPSRVSTKPSSDEVANGLLVFEVGARVAWNMAVEAWV
jgi:hypothetical protein